MSELVVPVLGSEASSLRFWLCWSAGAGSACAGPAATSTQSTTNTDTTKRETLVMSASFRRLRHRFQPYAQKAEEPTHWRGIGSTYGAGVSSEVAGSLPGKEPGDDRARSRRRVDPLLPANPCVPAARIAGHRPPQSPAASAREARGRGDPRTAPASTAQACVAPAGPRSTAPEQSVVASGRVPPTRKGQPVGVAGSRRRLSAKALTATMKLEPDIDSAAISGRSTSPKAGSNTPAAIAAQW